MSSGDAVDLRTAWTLAARIRNATMLLRGRATDTIPTDARERAAVAELLGYAKGEASFFLDDWTRRARHRPCGCAQAGDGRGVDAIRSASSGGMPSVSRTWASSRFQTPSSMLRWWGISPNRVVNTGSPQARYS